ncbi:class I SAM-dependent methyltransferase [Rhizobium leguminosarum]|nr:class I SAM-dependent methyltransferase [Rhizobium leguminosarum]MBY5909271.1 class I SAM-dependent methyltransferase [Rhizobium leguminosarum]NKJ91418.1 class I SAM-dependent methyltransferase [Rhizobium leguminosarum bv. viciae]QIO58442.1 class I SAM-dependent methyltransferase [Rhizobium leguminosarum bv. trifolii]
MLATQQTPQYSVMDQFVESICYRAPENRTQWYPPLMRSAESLAQRAISAGAAEDALAVLRKLEPDDYSEYLSAYYTEGIGRFGANWRYADIVTVLLALAVDLKPKSYLEIGVRRGRSVCTVAAKAPACDIYMFDMWVANYAGMENPGESLVSSELDKVSHTGKRVFTNGNSHSTLKTFFRQNSDLAFDMITVDGDHTRNGAIEDLCDVLPRLKIGGAVVFDDICHPKHRYLEDVWKELVVNDNRFTSWSCADIGYGVGFALRKW